MNGKGRIWSIIRWEATRHLTSSPAHPAFTFKGVFTFLTSIEKASCLLNALQDGLSFAHVFVSHSPRTESCHVSFLDREFLVSFLDRTWVRVLRIPHWSASPPPSPDDTRRSHAYSWEVVEREWSVAAPRRNVMGWGVEGTSAVSGAPLFDTRLWRCSLFQAYF